MVKHNNVLQSAHLRKHWQGRVRCFFNTKAHKKIRAQNRAARAAAAFPRPLGKLRPLVMGMSRKYSSKVKTGRGFSLAELKAAGLAPLFAQSVGIAVDHRRHNKNAETMAANVKRLNDYKSKLILFPRVEGKPKKGLINDSTADQLKKTPAPHHMNDLFAVPAQKKRCKIETITKEMREAKVYAKLRKARTDKKLLGKRQNAKKAKEAEKK